MPDYRYAVHGSFAGVDTMRNVFYLHTITNITDHTVVCGELLNALYGPVAANLSDTVELSGADVSEYSPGTGWGVNIFYPSIVVSGTSATEALPHQVAACVTAYTIEKGVRGRKFISGLHEDVQADGILDPTALGRMSQFATAWQNGITPVGQPAVTFKIFSEKTGLFHGIRVATARGLLATMRTRKPGRGLG